MPYTVRLSTPFTLAIALMAIMPISAHAQRKAAALPVRTDARGIEQVRIPAGTFMMGTSDAQMAAVRAANAPAWVVRELASEGPQHRVRITSPYWIDRFEVTNRAYNAFVADGGYTRRELWSEEGWRWRETRFPTDSALRVQTENARLRANVSPQLPRVDVTWYEADAYARWRGGRLPTEAQWEYAARGPKSPVYPWGATFDPKRANLVNSTAPDSVGSHPSGASWAGVHDMAGNAMEWVSDWLATDYYRLSPGVDPTGPATGVRKVEKGGWWGSNPFVARSAYRHFEDPPEYGDKHIGFRIVTLIENGR